MFGRRPFEGRTAESLTASIVKDAVRISERAAQLCSPDGIMAVKQVCYTVTLREDFFPFTKLLPSFLIEIQRRG